MKGERIVYERLAKMSFRDTENGLFTLVALVPPPNKE